MASSLCVARSGKHGPAAGASGPGRQEGEQDGGALLARALHRRDGRFKLTKIRN